MFICGNLKELELNKEEEFIGIEKGTKCRNQKKWA